MICKAGIQQLYNLDAPGTRLDVPEVLNVHVNKSKIKSTFFRMIFFSSSEKLSFEKEKMIF